MMRWAWGWACAGLLATAAVAPAGWQAGAARVDITPEGPVWLAGYASRKAPSEGVVLPIHAKALALRDDAGTTIVLVTIDISGVKRALTERVKARIAEAHGVPPEAVVLLCSHTHCGPSQMMDVPEGTQAYQVDPKAAQNNVSWTRAFEDKLVRVAGEALQALAPATLSYGQGFATFAMNRREPTATGIRNGANPLGPTDRTVPVLKVTGPDGAVRAVLFGYACHNTSLGAMLRVAGDYAGFAQAAIEAAHPGCVALFATGCGADANPLPRGTVEHGRRYGGDLADAVKTVCDGRMTPLTGALRFAAAEPTVRFAGPVDRASYEKRLEGPDDMRKAHARRMLERLEANAPIEASHPYPIQAFHVGDQLTLLALASEVVADYALRLQRERGGPGKRALWVAAYANDVFGYIPSLRVLKEGGYEGGEAFYYSSYPTPFADDVEDVIVTAAERLIDKVDHAP